LIGNGVVSARQFSDPENSRNNIAVPEVPAPRGDKSLTSGIGLDPKKNIGPQPHRVLGKAGCPFYIGLAVSSGSAYKN
jgi:hypothetical protein